MAKVDLQQAYWHIPVHHRFRRFLSFRFQGKDFQFKAMPFGLSVTPISFTAVMRLPFRLLRKRGHSALNYLDDWIVWADTFLACQVAVQYLLWILGELGFLVNHEKSQLIPCQSLEWLGIRLDSRGPSLSLPLSSGEKLVAKVSEFSVSKEATKRKESLLGSMAFVGQWLPEAKWAFYRFLPILALFSLFEGFTDSPSPPSRASSFLVAPVTQPLSSGGPEAPAWLDLALDRCVG